MKGEGEVDEVVSGVTRHDDRCAAELRIVHEDVQLVDVWNVRLWNCHISIAVSTGGSIGFNVDCDSGEANLRQSCIARDDT